MHQLDVAIPLQLKSQLKKGGSGPPCIGEGDSDISDTMQFVMLTRKGNKQQVTCAEDGSCSFFIGFFFCAKIFIC